MGHLGRERNSGKESGVRICQPDAKEETGALRKKTGSGTKRLRGNEPRGRMQISIN